MSKNDIAAIYAAYPDIIDVQTATKMLGVSRKTIYKLIDENKLSALKIGNGYKVIKLSLIGFVYNNCSGGSGRGN